MNIFRKIFGSAKKDPAPGQQTLLNLEKHGVPMKRVYFLSEELQKNPEQIALTQALTLNPAKPQMGLKGVHGLFGSEAWWKNINQKTMPLMFVSGVIVRAYVAGQDREERNNTIDLVLDDGSTQSVGIYTIQPEDAGLFRVGCRAEIVYALDELKKQPAFDGGINYSKVALEMAVSLQPISTR